MYNSTDVMAYVYEGEVYCVDCVSECETFDEGWGVVFADEFFDNDMGSYCCGKCNHNLDCNHKIMGNNWDNCPSCK